MIKKLYPLSFDINFFEYSEKHSCTSSNNFGIRPEFIFDCKENRPKEKVGIQKDDSTITSCEITKRYIDIDGLAQIKTNHFYYNLLDNIKEDDRILFVSGIIDEINEKSFKIKNMEILYPKEISDDLKELFHLKCKIKCIIYELNCYNNSTYISKLITCYIE